MNISKYLFLPKSGSFSEEAAFGEMLSQRAKFSLWSPYDVEDHIQNKDFEYGIHVRMCGDAEKRFVDGEGALEFARLMMLYPNVSFSTTAPLDFPTALRLQDLGVDSLEIQVSIQDIEREVQRPLLVREIVSVLNIPCWFQLEKGVECPKILQGIFKHIA